MGRFILLGSSMLFLAATEMSQIKYGYPVLGFLLLVLDLFWISLVSEGLAIQVFGWIAVGNWGMASILLLLFLFHRQSIQQPTFRIDANGLRSNFPWPKKMNWNAIEFIRLKDGMLTIEYRSGKLFQQGIEKDPALSEANFNEFCQQQCNP